MEMPIIEQRQPQAEKVMLWYSALQMLLPHSD